MKLLRVGPRGHERPAILDRVGAVRDVSDSVVDFTPAWMASGGIVELARLDPESFPTVLPGARIGSPLSHVGKIVCVGLNYTDHAAETGQKIPTEPILFLKGGHTIQGPNDDVRLPRNSTKSDWEVELGVIIARRALYVREEEALGHIAGYCVCNDLSEREFQLERGGEWDKGKNCETFGPVGPWLVTVDEVADPQELHLWLDVNGRRLQNGSTANMVFGVKYLVHYISQFMPLEPGDIISTGTPAGVGLGQRPPIFLRAGDSVRLGVEGLGEQRQAILAPE
jgi:2,4-diketo-3-deoxy-L-fuconate hydrolase